MRDVPVESQYEASGTSLHSYDNHQETEVMVGGHNYDAGHNPVQHYLGTTAA